MSFEGLLNDLEELKKAQAPAADEGDEKIQAAAETSNGDADPAAEGDENNVDDEEEEEGKGEMTKSFTAVIDGEEQTVIDGTELIKSLQMRADAADSELASIKGARATENEHLAKSMGLVADMLKEQGALVKSLQAQVAKLSNEGRGRKSVTAPDAELIKSIQPAPEPLNAGTFMLKANAAYDAGRISGKDLTVCDVAVRMGSEVDPSIIKKIMG